mmetsp:Transcript_10024/g.17716  ORF Transcript_10024/g.17716 Transcript_10024/m.17716 type:complete len:533 (+) Transcript_10024:1052-2650(+)
MPRFPGPPDQPGGPRLVQPAAAGAAPHPDGRGVGAGRPGPPALRGLHERQGGRGEGLQGGAGPRLAQRRAGGGARGVQHHHDQPDAPGDVRGRDQPRLAHLPRAPAAAGQRLPLRRGRLRPAVPGPAGHAHDGLQHQADRDLEELHHPRVARGPEGRHPRQRHGPGAAGLPLLGHADQAGDLCGRHQQHAQQRGGAQPVPQRREDADLRGGAPLRQAEVRQEGPGHEQRGALCVLHRARAAEHARGAGLLAHRRRLPRPPAQVPQPDQLLRDRLVHGLAGGRAAGGGVQVPGRREPGQGRGHPRRDRGHVPQVPRGRLQAQRALPRRAGPRELRHAHQLPGADPGVQEVAGGKARGGAGQQEPLLGRPGAARVRHAKRQWHAGGAGEPEAAAGDQRAGDREAHGRDPEQAARRGDQARGGHQGRGGGGGGGGDLQGLEGRGGGRPGRGHPRAQRGRGGPGPDQARRDQRSEEPGQAAGDGEAGGGKHLCDAGDQERPHPGPKRPLAPYHGLLGAQPEDDARQRLHQQAQGVR